HTLPSLLFFTAPPTTDIYTLSLHDALPICLPPRGGDRRPVGAGAWCAVVGPRARDRAGRGAGGAPRAAHPRPAGRRRGQGHAGRDRKSTRLNSSHSQISYAVFCLKKKIKQV